MCQWLHLCVYIHVFHQRCHILRSSKLLKGIEPKVRYVFILPLSACSFPVLQIHSRLLSSPSWSSPLAILLLLRRATSVPVLVFVVPAVEVYVERHNAAWRHASDEGPEGGAHTNQTLRHTKLQTVLDIVLFYGNRASKGLLTVWPTIHHSIFSLQKPSFPNNISA